MYLNIWIISEKNISEENNIRKVKTDFFFKILYDYLNNNIFIWSIIFLLISRQNIENVKNEWLKTSLT